MVFLYGIEETAKMNAFFINLDQHKLQELIECWKQKPDCRKTQRLHDINEKGSVHIDVGLCTESRCAGY